ncbi:MAG TPA: alcohol dehydrogenase catalytic domain-containing protein [Acidimicrobiales bacterium]|nr:alcohol dehydrogenase catalytic domain-containing protein [Acidimicrobiales bacterium]HUB71773.1 alcohol dehydrogenase catalytic domain-containing protein [Acidimicrobiales bacterium]
MTAPGEVTVEVSCAGFCGTDMEFYKGTMVYLAEGRASYPVRIGHEWAGVVSAVGEGADRSWLGRRVTGDTMLGCGNCRRCLSGFHHVCQYRTELGIRGGRPGAMAERVSVPARSLCPLPDEVDDSMGAMVEPAGSAWRAVSSAALRAGDRVLVAGAGTIGLLTAMFARAVGAEPHLLERSARSREFARSIGFADVWPEEELPDEPWDAIIDATDAVGLPAKALELVEPGKRVVFVGIASEPSLLDSRVLALKDVTAVGILGASAGLREAVAAYASGLVDPRPLIASTLSPEGLAGVLAGERPPGAGEGPKFHVKF